MVVNPTGQIVLSSPTLPLEQQDAVCAGSETGLVQSSLHGLRGVRLGDRALARHNPLAIRYITRDTVDADDGAGRVTKRSQNSIEGELPAMYAGAVLFLDGFSLEHAQIRLLICFPVSP